MGKYKSLKDHVYDKISEGINNGTLKPKEKIKEKDISKELNISRTPVREALIQLVNEGYLEKKPRKGFIVKEIKQESVKEVYQIIGVLESFAASLALKNMEEKNINQMKKIADKIDIAIKYKDYRDYYKLQTEFHDVYINASHNKKLKELLDRLKKFFIKKTYYEKQNNVQKALKNTNQQHRKIIRLFAEKDEEGIKDYLQNVHWNNKYARMDSLEINED